MEQSNCIFTIGHGNRSLQELVDAVLSYDIDYLIDVRSTPYSRYCPQFSRESISQAINATGRTKYAYLGDQLGGFPKEPEYQRDGKTDFEKYSQSERFQTGIARLRKGCCELGLRLCIMCSESDPTNCHRTRLISNELEMIGVPVRHIVFLPEGFEADRGSEVDTDMEPYQESNQDSNPKNNSINQNQCMNDPVSRDYAQERHDKSSVSHMVNCECYTGESGEKNEESSKEVVNHSSSSGCGQNTEGIRKTEIQTTLLTHAQVLAGVVRKLKTTGRIITDTYPEGGLFS